MIAAIKGQNDQHSKIGLKVTDTQTESSLTLTDEIHIFQRTAQPCSATADTQENRITEGWHNAWGTMVLCAHLSQDRGINTCYRCRDQEDTQFHDSQLKRHFQSLLHLPRGLWVSTQWAHPSPKGSLKLAKPLGHIPRISHQPAMARLLSQARRGPC